MLEFEENKKLRERLEEEARVFAYAIDPKEWKSFTPIHRKAGYKAGSIAQLSSVLVLIDTLINANPNEDSNQLKKLRRLILALNESSN